MSQVHGKTLINEPWNSTSTWNWVFKSKRKTLIFQWTIIFPIVSADSLRKYDLPKYPPLILDPHFSVNGPANQQTLPNVHPPEIRPYLDGLINHWFPLIFGLIKILFQKGGYVAEGGRLTSHNIFQ